MLIRRTLIAALVAGAMLPAGGGGARAALPIACADPCTVSASAVSGYTPAVVDLASGTSVLWTATDSSHPTTEYAGRGEPCFFAVASATPPASPVKFDLAGGVVTANGTPCTGAAVLPDGSALVSYHCLLHPNMNGVLRVEP